MIRKLHIKVPYDKIVDMDYTTSQLIHFRFEYAISNEVVFYNKELNIHYVIKEINAVEDFKEMARVLVIVIDVLEDIKEIGNTSLLEHQINSLGELLPTKRAEKFGREN